jgi:hypothetical protein
MPSGPFRPVTTPPMSVVPAATLSGAAVCARAHTGADASSVISRAADTGALQFTLAGSVRVHASGAGSGERGQVWIGS